MLGWLFWAEVAFALTSIVFEAYIVFDIDLASTLHSAVDVPGWLWHFYASQFDPVFLDPPPLLRLMCALDMFVFGPFHVLCAVALVRRQSWIHIPSLILNRCAS